MIQGISTINGRYGRAVRNYDFESMQYKVTKLLYGKKRFIMDIKRYNSIYLAG